MSKKYQLLEKENVASIREIQINPSKVLKGITRVVKGGKTMGFYFSNEEFDEILEDIAAMASKDLRKRVKEARLQLSKGDSGIPLEDVAKSYGL